MFLGINSDIKNLEELEERYQKNLKRYPSFSAIDIRDHLINIYYRCCIEEDMSVDDFMNCFKIKGDKDEFVDRATKIIEESKQTYLKNLESNIKLILRVKYPSYNKETVKQIYSFVCALQQKQTKSIKMEIFSPEKGFKKSDLENLLDLSEVLNQDLSVIDKIEDTTSSLSEAIEAYGKMDEFVDKINKRNLSPFEKFLLVHDYAANRIYKDAGYSYADMARCRDFVKVMTNDTIVCVGYANILKEFCTRLGIECMYIDGAPNKSNPDDQLCPPPLGHAANIVHIVDNKYGIDGYYFCDSCWDSKTQEDEKTRKYFYSALPIQDIDKIEQSIYFNDAVSSLDIPKSSKPISLKTFRSALNTIYSDKDAIEKDLQGAIKTSSLRCKRNADNAFTKAHLKLVQELDQDRRNKD